MYRLWFAPMSAAMAPCSVLEESGAGFELREVRWGEPWPDELKRLHPLGRIPVLEDGALVLFESAAIVMHLCDRHPQAGLAPAPGTPARAHFYQWLLFYASTLHPATKPFNFPQRFTDEPAAEPGVRRAAARSVAETLAILDRRMGRGPWVLGGHYSACDHVLHQFCSWFERPQPGYVALADYPNLKAFLGRVRERSPGVRRLLERMQTTVR